MVDVVVVDVVVVERAPLFMQSPHEANWKRFQADPPAAHLPRSGPRATDSASTHPQADIATGPGLTTTARILILSASHRHLVIVHFGHHN